MQTLEIHYSPWRMGGLLAVCVIFVALGAAMVSGSFSRNGGNDFHQLAGYAGIFFFGGIGLFGGWKWLTHKGAVIEVTNTGIRDTRVADREIPWTAIERMGVWEYHGQKCIILGVDPQTEEGLGLSAIARRTRAANAALGADGLAISATGLTMKFQPLHDLIAEHLRRTHQTNS